MNLGDTPLRPDLPRTMENLLMQLLDDPKGPRPAHRAASNTRIKLPLGIDLNALHSRDAPLQQPAPGDSPEGKLPRQLEGEKALPEAVLDVGLANIKFLTFLEQELRHTRKATKFSMGRQSEL